jgi:hypothetical protein
MYPKFIEVNVFIESEINAWELGEFFSYYGNNKRITLIRGAGGGMNTKHKFFYIYFMYVNN